MKFLIDMNLSPLWAAFLHQAGFEAVHWSAIVKPDAPDFELMTWAAAHRCILLTNDLDFSAILAATNAQLPSVVQIRSDYLNPDGIGRQLLAALAQARDDLNTGALLSVDISKARLRILPMTDQTDNG